MYMLSIPHSEIFGFIYRHEDSAIVTKDESPFSGYYVVQVREQKREAITVLQVISGRSSVLTPG